MAEIDSQNANERTLTALAETIFGALTRQFPVCMASDEFHFFPQARATDPDWARWDDFSPAAMGRTLENMQAWKEALDGFLGRQIESPCRADAEMLLRVVGALQEQFDLLRVYEYQPTFYLTIVGIGLAEALEAGPDPLRSRIRHLAGFLDQARHNLRRIPLLFRDLGLEMLAKQRAWVSSLTLPDAGTRAVAAAYDRLAAHLQRIPVRQAYHPAVAHYERIARQHMGCGISLAQIDQQLTLEIAETRELLARWTAEVAPGQTWQAAVQGLDCPKSRTQEVYHSTIDELKHHCLSLGLITSEVAHQCPVTVRPIPDYMRPVRSNAAFSMPPVHPPRGGTFYILEQDGPPGVPPDYRLLAAHETFPGHHLLDTCRWGHPRWIRRHIEFPLFYEGWASFAEEWMFESGFFGTPADHLLMAKRRFWRAMRGKIDFDLHTRRQTGAQATASLVAEGMDPSRARAMVRRYRLKPGYQLAYTIGRRRFRSLYERFRHTHSDPVAFARTVLDQGQIGFPYLEPLLQ